MDFDSSFTISYIMTPFIIYLQGPPLGALVSALIITVAVHSHVIRSPTHVSYFTA